MAEFFYTVFQHYMHKKDGAMGYSLQFGTTFEIGNPNIKKPNNMKIEQALQKTTRKALALMKRGHVSAYIRTLVAIEQLKQELSATRNNSQVAHS